MLISELDDKAAPLYLIALWAHCQQRRAVDFHGMALSGLKAVCRYEGEASKLRSALERCGWIELQGEAVHVRGFAELNAKLVANWENGLLGGRPRVVFEPTDNPPITQLGIGLTHPEPSREEKSRKEKTQLGPPCPGSGVLSETDRDTAPQVPKYSEQFLTFWKHYPDIRKTSKRSAWKAWQAAIKRALPAVILAAVKEFAVSPWGKSRFCPGPAPWLNGDRWDDARTAWNRDGDGADGQHAIVEAPYKEY